MEGESRRWSTDCWPQTKPRRHAHEDDTGFKMAHASDDTQSLSRSLLAYRLPVGLFRGNETGLSNLVSAQDTADMFGCQWRTADCCYSLHLHDSLVKLPPTPVPPSHTHHMALSSWIDIDNLVRFPT